MYVTYIILVITILVSIKAFDDQNLLNKFLFNPYGIIHHKQWYRVFSHAFIHADFMHLGFNMYVLYMFGVQVTPYSQSFYFGFKSLEPALVYDFNNLGYVYFAILYVGGIIVSSLYALLKHRDNPNYNSLGASGAVSAVVFGSILLNPTAQMGLLFLPFYIPAYIFGPLMLVAEYFLAKRGGTRIAHDAHIGGALFGLLFVSLINPNYVTTFFKAIFNG
ncbi:MAG TPA: rhomboid family intramembrane serine protease [Crocinitomix sp.]|nr:rhomboid family intramembrane serine protease [Crocinitomix sp.]